ncbi:MAG: hypothetical protein FJ087_21615 [Deltaproteobacteria bacterium]|nr:hypothetical protein [Deltaproteobacteria bacterium]
MRARAKRIDIVPAQIREVCSGSRILQVSKKPAGVEVVLCRESRDPDTLGAAVPIAARKQRIVVEAAAGFALADALETCLGGGRGAESEVPPTEGCTAIPDLNRRALRVARGRDRKGRPTVEAEVVDEEGRLVRSPSGLASLALGGAAATAFARLLRALGAEAEVTGSWGA